jgi:predicted Mrr-cat superfamily restriction endonuclease
MLEELAENAPTINLDARYWFVRSEGGELYPTFIATNSIAIAYRRISLKFIKDLDQSEEEKEKSREKLKEALKKHYPPTEGADGRISDNSGLAASQLLRFCLEMKRGDIVVIPSEKTEHLAIGKIEDDGPFEQPLMVEGIEWEHNKRRKVRWIRRVDKDKINPNLFKLFQNQQTVVAATVLEMPPVNSPETAVKIRHCIGPGSTSLNSAA